VCVCVCLCVFVLLPIERDKDYVNYRCVHHRIENLRGYKCFRIISFDGFEKKGII